MLFLSLLLLTAAAAASSSSLSSLSSSSGATDVTSVSLSSSSTQIGCSTVSPASSSSSSSTTSTSVDTEPPSALHAVPISSAFPMSFFWVSCCLAFGLALGLVLKAFHLKNSNRSKKPCASRSFLAFLCLLIVLADILWCWGECAHCLEAPFVEACLCAFRSVEVKKSCAVNSTGTGELSPCSSIPGSFTAKS